MPKAKDLPLWRVEALDLGGQYQFVGEFRHSSAKGAEAFVRKFWFHDKRISAARARYNFGRDVPSWDMFKSMKVESPAKDPQPSETAELLPEKSASPNHMAAIYA